MKLFEFYFEEEEKCYGCGWRTRRLYVLAEDKEEARELLEKGLAGLCADCMCELLKEDYEIISHGQ